MLDGIRAPQKVNQAAPDQPDQGSGFAIEEERQQEPTPMEIINENHGNDFVRKPHRQLEMPKYLAIVLLLIAMQNYSEIRNFFSDFTKNEDIVYASEQIPSRPIKFLDMGSGKILPIIGENHLVVPSLSIDAPISWEIPNQDDKTEAAMLNGLIQIAGSALPGDNGNIYITGHSSNYAWKKSDYNTIFAHLNKLKAGDLVYLRYQDTTFTYQVTSQEILKATDLSLLHEKLDFEQLSLVTCWPIGTSDKRMVVLAKRI